MYWPAAGKPDLPNRAAPRYSQDETETAFLAGAFLDWLAERPGGAPWCAHLSFLRPHPPCVVPAPFNELYDPADGPPFRRTPSAAAEAAQHPYLRSWLATAPAGHICLVAPAERRDRKDLGLGKDVEVSG